jgi:flagellar biosynthesis protein FlhG
MSDPRSPRPPSTSSAAPPQRGEQGLSQTEPALGPERALEPAYALLDLNSLDPDGEDLAWADALLDDPLEGLFRSPDEQGERPTLPEDFFSSRLLPPSVAPGSYPSSEREAETDLLAALTESLTGDLNDPLKEGLTETPRAQRQASPQPAPLDPAPAPSSPAPKPAPAPKPSPTPKPSPQSPPPSAHPMSAAQPTQAQPHSPRPQGAPILAEAPTPPQARLYPHTLPPITPPLTERPPSRRARVVIAVAGGKGGVGRTLITASLALLLPKSRALSVVLVDADPCGANLHTALCLEPHLPQLGELLRATPAPIRQSVSAPHGELKLYRAPPSLSGAPSAEARRAAIEAAEGEEVDIALLDLGAHPDPVTLDAFNRADLAVTVFTPSPYAVERLYSFLRAALYRRLLDTGDDASIVARALLMADHVGNLQTPVALVQALSGVNPEAAGAIRERLQTFTPQLILNHCRTHADRDLLVDVCASAHRRWRVSASPLGAIDSDDVAYKSQQQRQRRALVLEHPGAVVCHDLDRLSRRVMSLISERLKA